MKVSEMVEKCPLEMDGIFTWENLNVFPLSSNDVLIGMDWLEMNKLKPNFYNKTFKCIDDGNQRVVIGIPKVLY